MKASKKRCGYCGRWFQPDPHTAKQQKSCGRSACRRARSRQKQRRWRALNPDYERSRRAKVRVWVKAYPDYYRQYRASHPEYAARDNLRRVRARRRAKVSANVTALRLIVVEKASRLGIAGTPRVSANVTALSRRVEALEDCLRSTVDAVVSAKQTAMAPAGLLAG
jgi:hypothetical protein